MEHVGDQLLKAVGLTPADAKIIGGIALGSVLFLGLTGGVGLAATVATGLGEIGAVAAVTSAAFRRITATEIDKLDLDGLGDQAEAARKALDKFTGISGMLLSSAVSTKAGLFFVRDEDESRFRRVTEQEYHAAVELGSEPNCTLQRIQIDEHRVTLSNYVGGKLHDYGQTGPAMRVFEAGHKPVVMHARAGETIAAPDPARDRLEDMKARMQDFEDAPLGAFNP
jgi:hypothetical protein